MATTEIPWQYDPCYLFPQWDAHAGRVSYRHPTPPWQQDHGPRDTFMGWTLAGAQEMCRLENLTLATPRRASPRQGRPQGSLGHPKPDSGQERDGYKALVTAIIGRAVQDAQGRVDPRCAQPVAKLVQEARQWLAEGTEVTELLERAGYDAAQVLPRLQQDLGTQERTSA